MRICIDARPIINKQTGLGRYIYNIINSLKKVDNINDYLILVDDKLETTHPIFSEKNDRFDYKKCPIPGITFHQQLKLHHFLKDEKFDVFHYPHFDLPISVSKKVKSVFTVHDLTYLLHRGVFQGAEYLKKYYTKMIMNLGIKYTNKIITVSDSTKIDLINYFNLTEFNISKIETVHEACESNFITIKDAKLIKNFMVKWNLNKPYFLFIGERRPHKNLIRQIEAFNKFGNLIGEDYDLIIIGKNYSNYFEPEKITEQLNIANKVRFLGYVDDDLLPLFYNCATAFMFSSLYEGFGIPILEAMSCGVPVITSKISSMPEIAADAALKVNPYDVDEIVSAMITIVKDEKIRAKIIDKGKDRIREFSWEKTAEQTLKIYESVMRS